MLRLIFGKYVTQNLWSKIKISKNFCKLRDKREQHSYFPLTCSNGKLVNDSS